MADDTAPSSLITSIRSACWKFVECIKMDAVCEGKILNRRKGLNQPNINGLTRQVKQEVSALKCLGFTLVTLAIFYVIMSIINSVLLSRSLFDHNADDQWSKGELYKYTKQLNIVKLAHSCILVTLTVPIAFLTTRNRPHKSKKRYDTLLMLTIVLEMCYLIPFIFIVKKSLEEKN